MRIIVDIFMLRAIKANIFERQSSEIFTGLPLFLSFLCFFPMLLCHDTLSLIKYCSTT
jgi:hypothetical protein